MFQSHCALLHCHQLYMRAPVAPHPCHWYFLSFHFSHFGRCVDFAFENKSGREQWKEHHSKKKKKKQPKNLIWIVNSNLHIHFLVLLWDHFLAFKMRLMISPGNPKPLFQGILCGHLKDYSILFSSPFSPCKLELRYFLELYTNNKS